MRNSIVPEFNWLLASNNPPSMGLKDLEYYASVPVLGYLESGKILVVTYEQSDSDTPPAWFSNCSERWNLEHSVTHWMPLPLPPDKGTNNA